MTVSDHLRQAPCWGSWQPSHKVPMVCSRNGARLGRGGAAPGASSLHKTAIWHAPAGYEIVQPPEDTRFLQLPFLKSWNTRLRWSWRILAWI